MSDNAFRGTLLLLQNRTRRDPESYREEFLAQWEHFKASSATVAAQRVANPQYIAVLNFVCHVSHCFPEESKAVVRIVLDLLRSSKGNRLPADLRTALVKSLLLLRSKELVSTDDTFPVLFLLLQERDKHMRQLILSHIVSDIRKVNMPGAKGGAQVNKKAQNFLFSVMAEDDPVQARCAEMVMIDLYRRRVWCDERTVEVLTKACFSRHQAILRTALRFFLLQMPKISSLDDEVDDEEEEQDPGRSISKLKQKLKIVKKTSKRDRVLKRNVRDIQRKYHKDREEETLAKMHVDPIRLLRDPQQFVERLHAKLQKTSERFEIRILYLNVIARTVSEHEVVHLPLYGFLERYAEPSQLHSTQLLALSAMCVHRMVPPDAIEPLVKSIANHFVSDRSAPDSITVGINTIREICKRQPLAMNEDLLKDLAEYRNQRGDKGVMMAARALIQLYRDVQPELLPAKYRGSKAGPSETGKKIIFGAEHVYSDIPGLELLYNAANENEEGSQACSSCCSSEEDEEDDSSSGEWMTDSDSEIDPDDVEGEFVDVASDDDAQDDACPQLVPANGSEAPRKRARLEVEKKEEQDDEEAASGSDSSSNIVIDTSDDESGEWVEASDSDMEEDEDDEDGEDDDEDDDEELEEDEDEDEDEDDDEDEEDEEEEVPASLSAAMANAGGRDGWFEDTDKLGERRSVERTPSVTSSKLTAASISSSRVLTDEDFAKIRQLQAQSGSHLSLRGKRKERDAREKRRQDLIHGISADLTGQDIEHFTEKKKELDKLEKIERARELRKAASKFEIRKKKKSKLNSTHGEHSKRGKLFQMTKRSQRVATKLKSSVADRATRAKEMKKKDIKFRIKRGWKA